MRGRMLKRFSASLIAALTVTAISPVAAPAAPEMKIVDRWSYDLPSDTDFSEIFPGALVLNPSARTAFQMIPRQAQKSTIRVLNLDTMKLQHEIHLDVAILRNRGRKLVQYIHGLDEDNNVLYLAYSTPQLADPLTGVIGVSGETGEIVFRMERKTANDPTDVLGLQRTPPRGVEDVAPCTSGFCLPQTFGVLPGLVAMEFVPSFVSGSRPKLLMLWVEGTAPTTEGNYQGHWATQWDIEERRQDFNYRISSCTVRPPDNTYSQYPLTIFQARRGAGIYVGCNAQGNTGQAVRILLDSNGNPAGEQTFPGPISVADVLADKDNDRLLFRVQTPSGDSYWVFDGFSSTYAGVVSTSLDSASTKVGLDPKTGRLYVMAGRSSRGNQVQEAALLTSDIRRSPAPQVTMHPHMYIETDLAIAVDTHHPSGKTRLFIHPIESREFVIVEDPIPVGGDEPLTDVDRFTADVEEKEGETAANYTATGHSYGFRALAAGGVQGMVPIGVDASGVTLRWIASQVRSQCMLPDREVRLGSIPFANLANAITSAEAASTSSEAGTVSDLREPSGRCAPAAAAPSPVPSSVPETFFGDDDKDGQSNTDETLGSEWPFFPAQCSGDGEDENVTTAMPADRRPVPSEAPAEVPSDVPATNTPLDETRKNPRATPVRLEDNRAAVRCSLADAKVDAQAESAALKIEGLPPGVEMIEVGSAGSFTNLYRGKTGGLVAETIAYVRDINIGNRIFIDAAYSRALAFAGGRPGTAGTTLDRRICGVSIPETAGRYDVIPIDTPAGQVPPPMQPIEIGDPLYDATQGTTLPDGSDGVSYPIGNVGVTGSEDDQAFDGVIAACGDAPNEVSQTSGTPLGQRPFLEILNRVLGSKGRATIPEPDRDLRQGSPGGYLASIQKDRLQQIGARAVSNDGSTQVPALEIQFYNDDPTQGRGRQLFQFAGVDASTTYGIYLLNPSFPPIDTGGDDLPPFDVTDDLVDYTGGPTLPPTYPPSTPPGPPPVTGVFAPVEYLYKGVKVLARSWPDAALAGGVLLLFAGPLVLMGRRRALRTLV